MKIFKSLFTKIKKDRNGCIHNYHSKFIPQKKLLVPELWAFELERENDKLKHTLKDMEKELKYLRGMSVQSNVWQLSKYDIDRLSFDIEDKGFEKITVCVILETRDSSEYEECFAGIWYGVKVIGESKGVETLLFEVTIEQTGDGCFISDFANKRRKNTLRFTEGVGNYIKSELERHIDRSGNRINVDLVVKDMTGLVYPKVDEQYRMILKV